MIRPGFLSAEERKALVSQARNGLAEHRVARRANAILLLDDGWSCERVAQALFLDDDTVRAWHKLYEERGAVGLEQFDAGGSSSRLSQAQEEKLKAWVSQILPRTTREIGAFIQREFGIVYESRSGLIALLHRLGLEYHKPEVIGRKLSAEKQHAFIEHYENLLNSLGPDEAVVFGDAVHPTHAARQKRTFIVSGKRSLLGCWAPKEEKLAVEQTSGRERINIHGALNLETGETRMIEVETVNAISTIKLLEALEALYPLLAMIHVFLDNAPYHHAHLVQDWLSQPGRRIKLHFIPAYCPHLNPIERLWGAMHRNVTHNKCYQSSREFAGEVLTFLRKKVPQTWDQLRDSVTDNFRAINPEQFRVLA